MALNALQHRGQPPPNKKLLAYTVYGAKIEKSGYTLTFNRVTLAAELRIDCRAKPKMGRSSRKSL